MALGAVVGIASSVGGFLGGVFATPSEKRAEKVMGGVIQSALTGNLTAVKCLDERRVTPSTTPPLGILKERQVWERGYQQVVTSKPELLQQYNANRSRIPPIDHRSPEAAAAFVLANPVSAQGVPTPNPVLSAAAEQDPAVMAAAKAGMPLWVLLAIAVGAGWLFYKVVVKKG